MAEPITPRDIYNGQAAKMPACQTYVFGETEDADKHMSVLVYKPAQSDSQKLAFVHHGRNGKADAPHMLPVIKAYLRQGYTVIAPNARYSAANDSAGEARDFTISAHTEDLARSIEWAKSNTEILGWDGISFALAGHSMGAYAATYLAATDYKDNTEHVLAISPFTSGERQIEARRSHPNGIEFLQRELPQAMAEWPTHDIFTVIDNLTMPVSVLVGEIDNITPSYFVADFYNRLPNPGTMEIVKGQHHCIINNDFSRVVENHLTGMNNIAVAQANEVPDAKPEL
ncbi:MAG: alpha/beta hydrolase [Alphaproteobacteria bacterium]|nr:alpha/beta hydrolase [Alphaproteobacteria bacterium]MCD8525973.1 alpha/beta hydrolase [Alphaproteobacteria bacterium]MCD8570909.1 alpha/beta hydrolase [Alphaproteobacteria bacterium]